MDLPAHLVGQRRIDGPLPGQGVRALEARRDDQRAEVAPAARSTGVTRVQVTLVDHLDVGGFQRLPQQSLDVSAAVVQLESSSGRVHVRMLDPPIWRP